MEIEVAYAEALDKLSILYIKSRKITNKKDLEFILKEYHYLKQKLLPLSEEIITLYEELIEINESLWVIEDKLRKKEREQEFDYDFIQLARSVYFTNDMRASVKKQINWMSGSEFSEVKSYAKY